MTSLFALRTLLFASELFAGSTLILSLAWLASSQKAASARHLTWAAAFAALLALPLLAALVPTPFQILLPAPPPVPSFPGFVDKTTALTRVAESGWSFDAANVALLLGALWLAGAATVALRFAIGMWGLAALKRRSRVYVPAPSDLPKVATSRQECELRLCDEEMGPITWGVLHPVVLLPKSAVSWPRERLHAVLLHELAHIRRRDSFAHLLSHIACALYWPNPFVWIGANRLCHEAEIAADDAAIVSGVKPSTYAEQLLQLAAEFRGRHTALSNTALFMAAPSALEARVKSALSPTQLRTGVTSMDVVKIAGFGLCAATAIAFAFPSLAQDATPSAPPEMAAPAAPAQPDAAPAPPAMAAPEMPPQPAPPPAPPAPPAEVNAPADAVDATAPVDAATADEPTDSSVHIVVDGRNLDTLSSADRKRIRIEVEKARIEAREAIAKARPEIEKARREAHEAMQKAKPEIDRAVAQVRLNEQTIRDVQPQIDAAAAEIAKAQPEIEKALAAAQPEIDRALAQVHADLADGHLDVRIQERVDAALKRAEIKIKAAQVRIKNTQREEQSKTAPDSN